MNNFNHDVLGEVSDETRWLKFLKTHDLVLLAITAMVCIMMLNIFPKTGFFIWLEIGIFLAMCIRVVLSTLTRRKDDYLHGGGLDYLEIGRRKRHYKRKSATYALGTEEKKK